ncbi:Dichlorochromopyrrolate synthase [Bienertia sinuspersici]
MIGTSGVRFTGSNYYARCHCLLDSIFSSFLLDEQHADTVSEESCSDTARYTTRDSLEARDVSKTVVEVTEKTEVAAYECTTEGNNGYVGDSKANNTNGHSSSNALRHGDENEECITGSRNSGSDLSLSAKEKVTVKVEEDIDMNIQHTAANSLCKMQDHESELSTEAHQEVQDFQSQGVDNIQITYERKKSGLGVCEKPQRQKVQSKNPSGARPYNPRLIRKPQGKVGKREIHSNLNNRQSGSLSSEVGGFCSLPESICQRKAVDITHQNQPQPQLLGGRKRKLPGASIENTSAQSQKVNVSKEDDLCARGDMASKPQNELVMCLESPCVAEGIALLHDSNPVDPHNVESNSTIMEDACTKGSLGYDLESLKSKHAQDPDFLNSMKVPQLKEILKLYKVRGVSKLKKEKMIEEVNKQLRAT